MSPGLFRRAIDGLVPYEPGKPVEEVQRELGLDRVVKLASNEGPFPPFPAALEAIARAAPSSTDIRTAAAWALRAALAERHGVALRGGDRRLRGGRRSSTAVAGGARAGRRDRLRLAVVPELRPRRGEARCRVAARCRCATTRTTSTRCSQRSGRERSSSTCVIRTTRRARRTDARELASFLERVPEHVLVVLDQAYFEYIDDPDYADGDRGALQGGAARRRAADVLEDLRARGAAGRLRGRRRPTSCARRARCGALSTSRRRAGGGAREHRRRGGDRAAARRERGGPRAARARSCASTGSSPRARRSATSSSWTSATDARALRAAAAPGRDRPAARRLRRARGDPGLGRHAARRTSSSPSRSDTSFRASRNLRR